MFDNFDVRTLAVLNVLTRVLARADEAGDFANTKELFKELAAAHLDKATALPILRRLETEEYLFSFAPLDEDTTEIAWGPKLDKLKPLDIAQAIAERLKEIKAQAASAVPTPAPAPAPAPAPVPVVVSDAAVLAAARAHLAQGNTIVTAPVLLMPLGIDATGENVTAVDAALDRLAAAGDLAFIGTGPKGRRFTAPPVGPPPPLRDEEAEAREEEDVEAREEEEPASRPVPVPRPVPAPAPPPVPRIILAQRAASLARIADGSWVTWEEDDGTWTAARADDIRGMTRLVPTRAKWSTAPATAKGLAELLISEGIVTVIPGKHVYVFANAGLEDLGPIPVLNTEDVLPFLRARLAAARESLASPRCRGMSRNAAEAGLEAALKDLDQRIASGFVTEDDADPFNPNLSEEARAEAAGAFQRAIAALYTAEACAAGQTSIFDARPKPPPAPAPPPAPVPQPVPAIDALTVIKTVGTLHALRAQHPAFKALPAKTAQDITRVLDVFPIVLLKQASAAPTVLDAPLAQLRAAGIDVVVMSGKVAGAFTTISAVLTKLGYRLDDPALRRATPDALRTILSQALPAARVSISPSGKLNVVGAASAPAPAAPPPAADELARKLERLAAAVAWPVADRMRAVALSAVEAGAPGPATGIYNSIKNLSSPFLAFDYGGTAAIRQHIVGMLDKARVPSPEASRIADAYVAALPCTLAAQWQAVAVATANLGLGPPAPVALSGPFSEKADTVVRAGLRKAVDRIAATLATKYPGVVVNLPSAPGAGPTDADVVAAIEAAKAAGATSGGGRVLGGSAAAPGPTLNVATPDAAAYRRVLETVGGDPAKAVALLTDAYPGWNDPTALQAAAEAWIRDLLTHGTGPFTQRWTTAPASLDMVTEGATLLDRTWDLTGAPLPGQAPAEDQWRCVAIPNRHYTLQVQRYVFGGFPVITAEEYAARTAPAVAAPAPEVGHYFIDLSEGEGADRDVVVHLDRPAVGALLTAPGFTRVDDFTLLFTQPDGVQGKVVAVAAGDRARMVAATDAEMVAFLAAAERAGVQPGSPVTLKDYIAAQANIAAATGEPAVLAPNDIAALLAPLAPWTEALGRALNCTLIPVGTPQVEGGGVRVSWVEDGRFQGEVELRASAVAGSTAIAWTLHYRSPAISTTVDVAGTSEVKDFTEATVASAARTPAEEAGLHAEGVDVGEDVSAVQAGVEQARVEAAKQLAGTGLSQVAYDSIYRDLSAILTSRLTATEEEGVRLWPSRV